MGKLGYYGCVSLGIVGGFFTTNYFTSHSPIDIYKKRARELGGGLEPEPVEFPGEMKTRFITKFINSLGDTHYNWFHTPLFPLLSPSTLKALVDLKPLISSEEYDNLERGLSLLDDASAVKHGVPPVYRCAISSLVRSMLHSRERVEREWRERKGEIERERGEEGELAPVVVVTGMGGSGGSFLQQLLACDDKVRHLTRWEQKDPVPFPTRQNYPFDSRREADQIWEENENTLISHVSKYKPLFAPPPSPSGPPAFDDILLLTQGLFFPLLSPPGNPFLSHFLSPTSAKAVYPYIKRFLSLSQFFNPPETFFVMCSPLHAYHLKEFSQTFDHPQSLIILLHRDPLHSFPPIAHQTAFHSLHLFRDLNNKNDPFLEKKQFGKAILEFMRLGVERMNEGKKYLKQQGKGDKIIDIEFGELGKDPIGVVKTIYKKGDWELTPETEKKMIDFIHAKFREVVVGGNLGGLEAFGLEEGDVNDVMGDYIRERGYEKRREERRLEWERMVEEERRREEGKE